MNITSHCTFSFGRYIFLHLVFSWSLFSNCLEQFLVGYSRRSSAMPTDGGAVKEEEE